MSGFIDTVDQRDFSDPAGAAGDYAFDADERVLEPDEEYDLRQGRLTRLGVLLIVGFFLPVFGPGESSMWPQFTEFPGFNLVGLVMFLPLLAGVLAVASAKVTRPPLRGALLLLAGLSPVLLAFAISGSFGLGGAAPSWPTTIYLWLGGALLLLLANRVRTYRPMRRSCYWVGVAGAVCYVAHLFVPVRDQLPIVEFATQFRRHPGLTIGLGIQVLFMARVCWLTLRNSPSEYPYDASDRAVRATRAWILAAIVVALTFCGLMIQEVLNYVAITKSLVPFFAGVGAVIKATFVFVGFALLVPAAVADLWIGRVRPSCESSV